MSTIIVYLPKRITINPTNCLKEEYELLKEYLTENDWKWEEEVKTKL